MTIQHISAEDLGIVSSSDQKNELNELTCQKCLSSRTVSFPSAHLNETDQQKMAPCLDGGRPQDSGGGYAPNMGIGHHAPHPLPTGML